MKRFAFFLTVALVVAPISGRAQVATPPPMATLPTLSPTVPRFPPPPRPSAQQMQAQFQQMQARMAQFESARLAARTRMLAALTPAHRQLLAQIVGDLAITSNPDADAAAARLDAALSPSESHAVVSIQDDFERQMQSAWQSLPNQPGTRTVHAHSVFGAEDAGHILLQMTATFIMKPHVMLFHEAPVNEILQGGAVIPPPHH